jgi:hypothetical protein
LKIDLALPMNRLKTWWLHIPYTWRLAFVLWLGMRLLLWVLGALLFESGVLTTGSPLTYGVETLTEGWRGALFGVWTHWDGIYYDAIVSQGYHGLPQLSAFFPLYPLLAKPFYWLGMHPAIALIMVSNLAFLPALGLYLEEAEQLMGKDHILAAGLALLLFPTSFYFYASYPHSLALLMILSAWKLAQKRKWLACAVVGLLLGLTHSSVIPLVVVLAVLVIRDMRQSPSKFGWVKLAVPAMPLAGVVLFLAWRISQGFPPFGEVQYQFWRTVFLGPVKVIIQFAHQMFMGRQLSYFAPPILIVSLLATFWAFRRKFFLQAVYLSALILFLASVTMTNMPLGSYNRLILIGFPIFLALASWMKQNRWAYRAILALSSVLYFIMCFAYLSWLWVA